MKVRDAVEEYGYRVKSKNLSPRTWGYYSQKLLVFSSWCEKSGVALEDIRAAHIRRFIDYTHTLINNRSGQPISTYTIKGYARVVKDFLVWCGKEDDIKDVMKSGVGEKVEMPKVDEKVIETFTKEQLLDFYKACEYEYLESLRVRDTAILSVLNETGIRAGELITLELKNVHLDKGDSYIKVFGKGRKEREVGLGDRARKDLRRYIDRFRPKSPLPYVFLNRYKQQLTVVGLGKIIDRLSEWGHIKGVRCSPHTFRHTYAINYLKQGGDLYKLSRLMGHSSVSVTEIYLKSMKQRDARNGGSVLDNL